MTVDGDFRLCRGVGGRNRRRVRSRQVFSLVGNCKVQTGQWSVTALCYCMLDYYISLHAGKLEHHTFPLCIPPPSTTQCSACFIICQISSPSKLRLASSGSPLRYTCLIAPALPDLASPCATFPALPLALVPSNIPQLTAPSSLTQPMIDDP